VLRQGGAEVSFAIEEYLALVWEVPEKRPRVDSGTLSYVRCGGLIEPVLPIEIQGRLLKAAARVCSASWHSRMVRR
jgi:hypothetical protein